MHARSVRVRSRLLVASLLVTAACSGGTPPEPEGSLVRDPEDQIACTRQFVTVGVELVDATGAPVTDADVTVWRVATREVVTLENAGLTIGSSYPVLDDSWLNRIDPAGEDFRVTARQGGREGGATLTIGAPGAGRCHVARLAGPERIVLE